MRTSIWLALRGAGESLKCSGTQVWENRFWGKIAVVMRRRFLVQAALGRFLPSQWTLGIGVVWNCKRVRVGTPLSMDGERPLVGAGLVFFGTDFRSVCGSLVRLSAEWISAINQLRRGMALCSAVSMAFRQFLVDVGRSTRLFISIRNQNLPRSKASGSSGVYCCDGVACAVLCSCAAVEAFARPVCGSRLQV